MTLQFLSNFHNFLLKIFISNTKTINWKNKVLSSDKAGYKEEILYNEGGETLERVAQRGSGGSIPGNIEDQVGQGSEQPDLVSDVPAHCGGVRLDDL